MSEKGPSTLSDEGTEGREEGSEKLWYKDAIIYEVHVKAFYDSTGDGVGDFRGITAKLDYIKDLGVTAIWILPFYPSPLKDDGYDIADYFEVHRSYGTLSDFSEFLREAHSRGLKVITELVLNHTSDQHPWFQASRRAEPGSEARNFYVWNNSPDKYRDARIIFKDFETSNWSWDSVGQGYYWHRFYSQQPDLNFDNARTQKTMLEVVAYWLKLGVDGLRLDAVPYLYEREGTNCENLPETHEFLKRLRAYIDAGFDDRMLLAEANQWPSDAVAYFGNGDECNMAYHFPLMPRMFMAIQMEDRFPLVDILDQTPPIPENCQWALFLRNHDELTLEMVTDEERDYMYRVYARDKQARINLGIRRRLAPLLDNDRRKIELANVLLFTMPGTPVIYYGDEIGMGDNYYLGDRNGVRTPMQWNADTNAGFSKTNPQKLYLPVIIEPKYHYETVNVENQESDPSSLLVWMKKLISVRKRHKAFGRGTIEFYYPDNWKILVFERKFNDELILVAANLSRYPQSADLDLSKYEGFIPHDVFGGNAFPAIAKGGYRLTFTAYGYYIFSLAKSATLPSTESPRVIPEISSPRRAVDLFKGKSRDALEEEAVPSVLASARWFAGKSRSVERVRIRDVVTMSDAPEPVGEQYFIAILDVYYTEGLPEAYVLPIGYVPVERATEAIENEQKAVVARVTLEKNEKGVIFDATYSAAFRRSLFQLIYKRLSLRAGLGEVVGSQPSSPLESEPLDLANLSSRLLGSEQSNTSVAFEDRFILKLFRRVEEGTNPELEIGEHLIRQGFPYSPKVFGELQYKQFGSEPITLGILQEFVRNQGDCWKLFSSEFSDFMERVSTIKGPSPLEEWRGTESILEILQSRIPDRIKEPMGEAFLDRVSLLGTRTGEFHKALASDTENPDFKIEPFTQLYQIALSQSMNSYANRVIAMASRANLKDGSEARILLDEVLKNQGSIAAKYVRLRERHLDAYKTRTHGDYHLGQVLYTGKDFEIVDYEGEPARSLSDRRLKRSPMKDIAGMVRSFHYAAHSNLLRRVAAVGQKNVSDAELWADVWYKCVSATFLKSYLDVMSSTTVLPSERQSFAILFDAYMLDKAVYELGYELNNRPDWTVIPLRGIRDILGLTTAYSARAQASSAAPQPSVQSQ